MENLFSDEPGAPGNGRVAVISEQYQQFNGYIYMRDENGRYYRKFNKRKHYLHHDVWRFHFGEPPLDYYIIHRDDNNANNDIENLTLIEKLVFFKKRHADSAPKETVCEWCDKKFTYTTAGRPSRFCSDFCRNKFQRARYEEERPCVICGKPFKTYKYHPAQTCSNECRLELCKRLREQK